MGRMSPEDLPPGHKYAVDTVTFIYFLERHPSYYQTAKRFFQRLEQGETFEELLENLYEAVEGCFPVDMRDIPVSASDKVLEIAV